MLNLILRKLGLVTIERAKYISAELIKDYVKTVQQWAKEDFHANPNPNAINDIEKWNNQNFMRCVNNDYNKFIIIKP